MRNWGVHSAGNWKGEHHALPRQTAARWVRLVVVLGGLLGGVPVAAGEAPAPLVQRGRLRVQASKLGDHYALDFLYQKAGGQWQTVLATPPEDAEPEKTTCGASPGRPSAIEWKTAAGPLQSAGALFTEAELGDGDRLILRGTVGPHQVEQQVSIPADDMARVTVVDRSAVPATAGIWASCGANSAPARNDSGRCNWPAARLAPRQGMSAATTPSARPAVMVQDRGSYAALSDQAPVKPAGHRHARPAASAGQRERSGSACSTRPLINYNFAIGTWTGVYYKHDRIIPGDSRRVVLQLGLFFGESGGPKGDAPGDFPSVEPLHARAACRTFGPRCCH